MTDEIELSTSIAGLVLRSLRMTDAPLVCAFHAANAERLIRYSPGPEPPPSDLETVEAMLAPSPAGQMMLGVWLHDEFIGLNYLVPYEAESSCMGCIGLGYGIEETHEGRGYTTAGVKAMTLYAIESLGAARVTALVADDNIPSRRVLQKAGFTIIDETAPWVRYGFEAA